MHRNNQQQAALDLPRTRRIGMKLLRRFRLASVEDGKVTSPGSINHQLRTHNRKLGSNKEVSTIPGHLRIKDLCWLSSCDTLIGLVSCLLAVSHSNSGWHHQTPVLGSD